MSACKDEAKVEKTYPGLFNMLKELFFAQFKKMFQLTQAATHTVRGKYSHNSSRGFNKVIIIKPQLYLMFICCDRENPKEKDLPPRYSNGG